MGSEPSIAVVATDLDGTLLDPTGRISTRTLRALAAARRAGMLIIAATGRTIPTARALLPQGVVDLIIGSNGATVWNEATGTVDLTRLIGAATTRSAMSALRSTIDGAGFGWETLDGCGFDEVFLSAGYQLDEIGLRSVPPPSLATGVAKLFVGHPDVTTGDDAMRELAAHVPATLSASTSGAPFLELTASGVDKATTLAIVCERNRVSAGQVIAFGDQTNDVAMLAWAGISVAVEDAHPSAVAVASETTHSASNDGVAARIEALLTAGSSHPAPPL